MHKSQNLRTSQEKLEMMTLIEKKELLFSIIRNFQSLTVAFSGGVDSSFLVAAAHQVLGENLLAITAQSPIHPRRDIEAAIAFAKKMGIRHVVIQSHEMEISEFTDNSKQRCYICKKHLFREIAKIAAQADIHHIAHGANTDDLNDFRPGFKAAQEMGIFAPMIEAGLNKSDIRILSQEMNLNTWNKPAMACLATRIPYGVMISQPSLKMIEDAEDILFNLGIHGSRVRHHETVARIEVLPDYFDMVLKNRQHIAEKFRHIGYSHISLDIEGYNQGALLRVK